MSRSMAVHDTDRCPGLAKCSRCMDRLWNGRTPVTTPTVDRLFNVFGGVVIALAVVYLAWHVLRVVVR